MTYVLGNPVLLGTFSMAAMVPMIIGLAITLTSGFGTSALTGTLNALIAAASEYTFRTRGKRIDGTMFSCSSLGMKIGGGIGSAVSGWLLALGGYVANAVRQPQSALNMLNFMYLWFPFISCIIILFILSRLKVEKANKEWDTTHA